MKTGIELIAQERERQILSEHWSAAHDDMHQDKELAQAAACYALDYTQKYNLGRAWPWDSKCWKPTPENPIKQLAKAGALIAAEIDRLQRL